MSETNWKARSLLAQAGGGVDPQTGAVVMPIHASTTYLRDPDNAYRRGFSYARDTHPNYLEVERIVASLEGGMAAKLLASGLAAATALFASLDPGDRVVAPRIMYWGLRRWLTTIGARIGITTDFVDNGDVGALRDAVRARPTKLVWVETPANPTWVITDIAAAAHVAKEAGALLAVDNTVPTPLLTRPIELGADYVMHSATKYLNGHSDLVAGMLVSAREDELWVRVAQWRAESGPISGGHDAWLLLRGMRTLPLRLEASCRGAMHLARRLKEHPAVSQVLYPGLEDHPGHAIAARQMHGGFGGMLSIRLHGGERAAIAGAAAVRLWKRATSLGGVESLIEHRASVEGAGTPVPGDLLRLSVGIEDPDDLFADLDRALGAGA